MSCFAKRWHLDFHTEVLSAGIVLLLNISAHRTCRHQTNPAHCKESDTAYEDRTYTEICFNGGHIDGERPAAPLDLHGMLSA